MGGQLQGAASCKESLEHDHGNLQIRSEYYEDELGRLREEPEMLRQPLADVEGRLHHTGKESAVSGREGRDGSGGAVQGHGKGRRLPVPRAARSSGDCTRLNLDQRAYCQAPETR